MPKKRGLPKRGGENRCRRKWLGKVEELCLTRKEGKPVAYYRGASKMERERESLKSYGRKGR